ncbi:hypothetical protein Tco_0922638, partial [Tanacetum coccineum]
MSVFTHQVTYNVSVLACFRTVMVGFVPDLMFSLCILNDCYIKDQIQCLLYGPMVHASFQELQVYFADQ